MWVSWGLCNRDSVVKGRLRAELSQSRARGHPGGPSAGRLWLLGKAEGQRRVQGHKASCHGAVTRVPWAKQLLSRAKVRVENLPLFESRPRAPSYQGPLRALRTEPPALLPSSLLLWKEAGLSQL